MIQCSRIAFGFVGIFDQDEAERIIEGQATHVVEPSVIPPEQVDDRTRGLVYKLIERAEASNAWNSALEYANEHFQGVELTFAKQEIFNAQQQAAKALTQPFSFLAPRIHFTNPGGIILPSGEGLPVFWRSSMTKSASLFAWYWLLPLS